MDNNISIEQSFSPFKILENSPSKLIVQEDHMHWRYFWSGLAILVGLALLTHLLWFWFVAVAYVLIAVLLIVSTKQVIHTYYAERGKLTIRRGKLFGGFTEKMYEIEELHSIAANPYRLPTALPFYSTCIEVILRDGTHKAILSAAVMKKDQAIENSNRMAQYFGDIIGVQVSQ
jgi:hypothetical protein